MLILVMVLIVYIYSFRDQNDKKGGGSMILTEGLLDGSIKRETSGNNDIYTVCYM